MHGASLLVQRLYDQITVGPKVSTMAYGLLIKDVLEPCGMD